MRQQTQDRDGFPGDLLAACPLIEGTGLHIALDLRPDGIAQALGVFLGPTESAAQKELAPAERDLAGAQLIDRQPPHVALVAQHPPGLSAADQPQGKQHRTGTVGHARRHHQGPGGQDGDRRGGEGHQHRPELDRRSQQGLDGMAAHCSMPWAEIRTG